MKDYNSSGVHDCCFTWINGTRSAFPKHKETNLSIKLDNSYMPKVFAHWTFANVFPEPVGVNHLIFSDEH